MHLSDYFLIFLVVSLAEDMQGITGEVEDVAIAESLIIYKKTRRFDKGGLRYRLRYGAKRTLDGNCSGAGGTPSVRKSTDKERNYSKSKAKIRDKGRKVAVVGVLSYLGSEVSAENSVLLALMPEECNNPILGVHSECKLAHTVKAKLKDAGGGPVVLCKARRSDCSFDYKKTALGRELFPLIESCEVMCKATYSAGGCSALLGDVYKIGARKSYIKRSARAIVNGIALIIYISHRENSRGRAVRVIGMSKSVSLAVRLPCKNYYIKGLVYGIYKHKKSPKGKNPTVKFYHKSVTLVKSFLVTG